MSIKLRTLSVVCSVAVLAISSVGLACDKHQTVAAKAQCNSLKTGVVQVADDAKQCSKSRKATTVAVASKKAGCAKSAATTETLALLAKAIGTMPDCDARTSVVTAYRTMAKANPTLVCEKQCAAVKAVLASSATCSSAKTVAVVGKSGSACCATKTKATQVANVKGDAAACRAAKAKGIAVAFGESTCSKSKQARYVAFGCMKTDKLARAAARGYLDLIRELKTYSGADGCPAATASKLLAQMLQDDSAQAQTQTDVKVETVANIETPVSLGAVSEVKTTKRSQCSSSKK